jgi:cyclopropane-fatty-acyl-phospholipid synthase
VVTGLAADPVRWPEIARVPAGPVRAAVARAMFTRAAARLRLTVQTPDGALADAGPGAPEMRINQTAAFFRRLGADGAIGFGESYMAGDWDTDDLAAVLSAFGDRYDSLVPAALRWLRPLYLRRRPREENQTIAGSRRNIRRHYDHSNELFAAFLDETLTYSCALFAEDAEGRPVAGPGALAQAQRRKIDRILDLTGVRPGTRLLEIGTGWGELAIRAARRGADVVTITNSSQQYQLAEQRVQSAGLAGRARVGLSDYREVDGSYDAVVSVEMIEAVGDRYWPEYFGTIDRLLAPGGRAALQAITLPHDRMVGISRTYSWMDRYIFPGAVIPSVRAIEETLARHTSLRIASCHGMGAHYAQTLRTWQERFTANAAVVDRLGFDLVFRRMWCFYLAYCEAGFRTGLVNVGQYLLTREKTDT